MPSRRAARPLSVSEKLGCIVLLFVGIVSALLWLSNERSDVFWGVRAYVGGEALWSKGQKDAVRSLLAYATSRDERDYQRFLVAIDVPLGDRAARQELQKPNSDPDAVTQGFLRGRNHPDDIPAMIMLFRHFNGVNYMAQAIDAWSAADRYILKLERLGRELHASEPTRPDPARVAAIARKIVAIDRAVAPLEDYFSRTLADGARWLHKTLLATTTIATAMMLLIGIVAAGIVLRHLKAWEVRYRHLVDAANDAIIVTEVDTGLVVGANRRAAELTGVSGLIGVPHTRFEPPGEQARYRDFLARCTATGVTAGDLHLQHADGRLIPVEISASTVELDGQQFVQGIFRDVTERQRYLAEVEQGRQRAEEQAAELAEQAVALTEARNAALEAARTKAEFLANMSHEIRTPLTAIIGYTHLLADPDAAATDRTNYVDTIRRNGKHLERIINDILDLSKIEAGKMTVERIACSPLSIVSEMASLMRPRALGKGLSFDVEYRGPMPARIQADPTRLRQILINLIGNAIKFTEGGGVRVVVRMAAPAEALRPSLRFEVVDTGIGIAPEALDRLFAPFSQGDASTTRKFGGTGLGLMISKRLAEMLGGDVTVQSSEGAGSTFVLSLETGSLEGVPIIENPSEAVLLPTKRQPADVPPPRLEGRVLLAEDAPDNQRLLSYYLRHAGLQVETADDGRIAYDLALKAAAENAGFDVILMDMQMPHLDGYGATSKLRRVGYTRPILALTAHAMQGDREKCLLAGCDDFLSKPVDPEVLIDRVRRHIILQREGGTTGAPPAAWVRQETEAESTGNPLVSALHADPEIAALVAEFVGRLPERIAAIEQALATEDLGTLAVQAHQLKGTAGGYGFPTITEAALYLEKSAREHEALEQVRAHARAVVDLCRRARATAADASSDAV